MLSWNECSHYFKLACVPLCMHGNPEATLIMHQLFVLLLLSFSTLLICVALLKLVQSVVYYSDVEKKKFNLHGYFMQDIHYE